MEPPRKKKEEEEKEEEKEKEKEKEQKKKTAAKKRKSSDDGDEVVAVEGGAPKVAKKKKASSEVAASTSSGEAFAIPSIPEEYGITEVPMAKTVDRDFSAALGSPASPPEQQQQIAAVAQSPPPPPSSSSSPVAPSSSAQTTCDIRMDPDNDVLVLRTPQVGTLHKVFTAMKELMTDLMIVVDRDQGTVSIDGFNAIQGYYVRSALRFEHHVCRERQLMFLVPASSFSTMLAKASPKHTVYLFVPQSSFVNGHVDYIHFQFETPPAGGGGGGGGHEGGAATRIFTISLPTLNDSDIDERRRLVVPPIAYPLRITLGSMQFRKDMSDLAEFSGENLLIAIQGEDCFFSSALQTGATLGGRIHYPKICESSAADATTSSAAAAAAVVPSFEGLYPLKIIKRIIKCSTLSSDVVLGISDTHVPMNFYYPIGADFGDMYIYLAPVNRSYGVA